MCAGNKRNAIILAAGTSSRFVPLSYEIPKGLLNVRGEVLIERQINQLRQAGVKDITIVVGYKAEMFQYLTSKYGVFLVYNEDFSRYNNTSSLIRVLDKLGDTFICSSDNYFPDNVFPGEPDQSYYSALFADGETKEYCIKTDPSGNITDVCVGGADSWYMIGHVYFSKDFSKKFKEILKREYMKPETKQGYWEDVYIKFIQDLPPMKIHRYSEGDIFEFDSLDELREFDSSYISNTHSKIIKEIADTLHCPESSLCNFKKEEGSINNLRFTFDKEGVGYRYSSFDNTILKL